ncbi:hypothetical protein AVEN_119188-1 [Araneus ventricosus]|uniref:Uncharacterized protein n=1 Tax=Araneus ventricosus TaxID=182803 RepID=A0A4Y2BK63_ARAVE|nr:hypothetical protein AVEN_119188-1 [Araneus ventricosus]
MERAHNEEILLNAYLFPILEVCQTGIEVNSLKDSRYHFFPWNGKCPIYRRKTMLSADRRASVEEEKVFPLLNLLQSRSRAAPLLRSISAQTNPSYPPCRVEPSHTSHVGGAPCGESGRHPGTRRNADGPVATSSWSSRGRWRGEVLPSSPTQAIAAKTGISGHSFLASRR